MTKVGLIGFGKWGKVLHKRLKPICDLVWVCNSKGDYRAMLDDVDWVFIATPDYTHYDIVSECLNAGKNVFCEKPLTLTYKESEALYDLAESNNLKLYVDDIHNFREYNIDFNDYNYVTMRKGGGGDIKNILYRLTYHDIYIFYEHIKDLVITEIKHSENEHGDDLQFIVKFEDEKEIEFYYDLKQIEKEHWINDKKIDGEEDILTQMLMSVLDDDVDYKYNKQITLYTNGFIDILNEELFKKVAVIGGGIFGSTTAWRLAKEGYNVTLYEKNDDICTEASHINQYRLHRGYHYPRSKETAIQSQWGEHSFLQEYSDAIVNGDIEHYYAIAKEDSLVTAKQYKKFLKDVDLYYKEKKLDLIHKNSVDLVVKVDEFLFNPNKLKEICWDKLNKYNVDVRLNTKVFDVDECGECEAIINATYTNINKLLEPMSWKNYQFELCEKPVIKLPEQYKNKSIVVMDGPFMCIDPLGDTGLHVMGNVVHAIHSTNVGKYPKIDEIFKPLLNNGIIKNPPITNINKFIDSAKKFFVDIDKLEHIGSMFTIRTVLPNKDKDDARPTLVEKVDDNVFTVFSGKIGTCVSAADEILEYV